MIDNKDLVSDDILKFLEHHNIKLTTVKDFNQLRSGDKIIVIFTEPLAPQSPQSPPLTQREQLAQDLLIELISELDRYNPGKAVSLDYKKDKIFPYSPPKQSSVTIKMISRTEAYELWVGGTTIPFSHGGFNNFIARLSDYGIQVIPDKVL